MLLNVIKRSFAKGKPIQIISPYTNKPVYQENGLTKTELTEILKKTEEQRLVWQFKPVEQRRAILTDFVKEIDSQKERIAHEITLQNAKLISATTNEVNQSINVLRRQLSYTFPERNGLQLGWSLEPFGNVVIASPYTTPFFTPCKYLIVSLLVGNTVLIKSSDQCMMTTNTLANTMKKVSNMDLIVPMHASLQVLQGVLEDKDTGFINFTGLTKTGHRMYQQIATKSFCFAQSVFHISASDAAYVREDSDIELACVDLARGALINSGQSRNAIKRIYVKDSISQKFRDRFVEEIKKYKLGDPFLPETNLSLITTQSNYEALLQLKDILKGQKEIELLYEGEIDPQFKDRRSIMPMVYHVKQGNTYRFENQQIYGPFVFIKDVDSDDTAVEEMNQSVFGKRCVIYSKDWQTAKKLGEGLDIGSLTINTIEVHHPDLPDSGRKRSGKGYSLGEDSIRNVGKTRSIIL